MRRFWLGALIAGGAAVLWAAIARPHAGATDAHQPSRSSAILYYRDPMHPSYTSSRPGKAPDCGMDLVPVYATRGGPEDRPHSVAADIVTVDPQTQRMLGVAVDRVEHSTWRHAIRTFGRVAPDENRLFAVTAGGDGWVVRTYPGTATGDRVRRGQTLAAIYGREYTTAQRTYLFALNAAANTPPAPAGALQNDTALALQEAELFLRNSGFGDAQLSQLATTRQVIPEVILTAPADGVIISRRLVANERFDRGVELFRIADLSQIWILADLYSGDDASVRKGSMATITTPDHPDVALHATVSDALPTFDRGSRTLRVRLIADNPALVMTPDMPVNVEIASDLGDAIVVPDAAIVDTGDHPVVFVAGPDNTFATRSVEIGQRRGGRVEIRRGLVSGESIVVSGTFFLDSELRMRGATR